MNESMMQQEAPLKNRWSVLLIIVLSVFMSALDGSIVNVALPTMADRLQVSSSAIAWVVSIYLIGVSATMLLFGRLGDILGKTRIFQLGMVIFTIGSLLCGLAHSMTMLLVARTIQSIGAAGMMSTSQGIITQVFPANERGRALGTNGTFVALGSLVGPSLGGFIVAYTSWEYIFWINVPIGIAVFLLSLKLLPAPTKSKEEKVDIWGTILFITVIVLLFSALGQVQNVGFRSPIVWISLLITLVLFVIFMRIENAKQMPLLELKLFRSKWFSISIVCSFMSFLAMFCSNIIMPFYLQDVLTFSPEKAGAFLSISPLVLALVAPMSGYLSDKIGSEVLTLTGLSLTSLSLFLMSTLNDHPLYVVMGFYIALMSLGNGLFQSPNTSLIMSTLPKNKLGIGGGVNAFVRNLGMICGITLASTLLYSTMSSRIGYHVTDFIPGRNDVFIYGMRIVYITAATICLIGSLITAYRLFSRKKEKKETA